MKSRTLLVVVVGFLLGLAALERWGEAAAGGAPTWLTAPDTIPPERILWEGVPTPLQEAQPPKVERCKARLRAQLVQRGIDPRREEVLEYLVRKAVEEGGCQAPVGRLSSGTETDLELQTRPHAPEVFPVVSIGQPEIWRLPDLYPLEKMPPPMQAQLQAADFYLIRLFCSFRPVPRSRVGWARFHIFLRPDSLGRQPIAYDISPLEITQKVKRQLKFTVAPTLKFRPVVEAEVGSLELGLEYRELQPIIVGAGIGEARPTWDYKTAAGITGIQGAKQMHLLVKAPKGMPAATAQLGLTAQLHVEGLSSWMPMVAPPAEWGARLDVPLWPEPQIP
jgi:hypothetical protein